MARATILDLLDQLAPEAQKAFIDAVADIASDTRMTALEAAIQRGDVQSALRVLSLEDGYFAPLDRALRGAYETGGDWAMAEFVRQGRGQGVQVAGRFDSRNLRAERFLREQSSQLITGPYGLVEEIRDVSRDVLSRGVAEGRAPRSLALDLVGRKNRATGRREGGVIGLTDEQAGWARKAEADFRSGDPARMRKYLDRNTLGRQDRARIERAIASGGKMSAEDVRRTVASYRSNVLRYRGEVIARTEVLASLHEAQDEGLRQMVDQGKVRQQDIDETWDSAEDSATRTSHRALDGAQRGPDGAFTTITGARLRYPGDTSLGAPASEVVQCRCRLVVKVEFIAGLRDRLTPEELAEARAALVE